jgi:acyl carrier protein
MDRQTIKQRIIDILSSKETMSLQVDVSEIHDETSLINDVALDSMQILELIVCLEEEFQFAIDTENLEIDTFDRFSDLVEFVYVNIAQEKQE